MSALQLPEPPTSRSRHIFVSSAEPDRALADAIVDALEARGIRCWIAHRDIPAGMTWAGAIVGAIVESQLMIVIVSKDSLVSPQVLREVTIADEEGVTFVPYCIDGTPLSRDFRYFFSTSQRLDVSRLSEGEAIDLLSNAVAVGDSSI